MIEKVFITLVIIYIYIRGKKLEEYKVQPERKCFISKKCLPPKETNILPPPDNRLTFQS